MSKLPVPAWSELSPEFDLPPGVIHVWCSDLDISTASLADYRALLSADERERGDRLIRPQDRIHFVAARGLLRRLLGWYLRTDPAGLRFGYQEGGRPFLHGDFAAAIPRFNLSHSGGKVLLAFSRDRELGIDLERLREDAEVEALATRSFAPGEVARLRALPERERHREFFRLWTCKEAYVKARGEGVVLAFGDFEVKWSPGGIPSLFRPLEPHEEARWILRSIDLGADYLAAIAYEAPEAELRLLQWS